MDSITEQAAAAGPPAGETEASMASVAAGKAKLAAMLAGSKSEPSTPPVNPEYAAEQAAKSKTAIDAEAARVAKLTPGEKRRQELSRPDNPDGIHSKDPKKKEAAMRELRAVLASQATEEEAAALKHEPLESLRERFGIKTHETLQRMGLEDVWDKQGEADVLASAVYHGVGAEDIRGVLSWYTDIFTGAVGNPDNVDVAAITAEFDKVAEKYHIPPKFKAALIERFGGGAA